MNPDLIKIFHSFLANPSITDVVFDQFLNTIKIVVGDLTKNTIEIVKNKYNVDISEVIYNNIEFIELKDMTRKKLKTIIIKNSDKFVKPLTYSLGDRIEQHKTVNETFQYFSIYDTTLALLRDKKVFETIKNEKCNERSYCSDIDGESVKKKVLESLKSKLIQTFIL